MPQFQLPKVIADRFLKHIASIANGADPDEVTAECILTGIEEIKSKGEKATRVKLLDAECKTKGISEQRTIKYTEIKEKKNLFNNMKIEHEIDSRRHLIREAAIVYCIKVNVDITV